MDIKNYSWIYRDFNGQIRIDRQKLYCHMKEHLKLKITDAGNIYLLNGNIYKRLSEREFKALIKEYLPVEYRHDKDWESIWKEFATDFPDVEETDFNSNENIVPFQNGILLLEYIGAILSNVKGWRFKKLLILVGAGNTGKTQLRELTMNLLGRENCISIDMKKINERFGAAQLYLKRLAGSGDMSTVEISEMAVIKNLTGGDSLFAEYKGKDGFSFRYDGLLWFNANALPHFRGDRGEHVYSRFVIIYCNNIIPDEERDPRLLDKLMSEKDVIASIAIDCLKNAIQRGYKFSESSEMIVARKEYSIENNSLLTFVNDCCECYTVGHKTKRSEFNRVYKLWCNANRVLPERDREIGKQLKEFFEIEVQKNNGHYYYPIKIKDEVFKEYDSTNYALSQMGAKYNSN
ncbi:DNA primase family protein [Bianquea renquensis]|jgi:phage/plasmid primase, P4 family, C-terminal domain|uniref:SF3 helicase domain-containing protein n=1 Tax=Bianquea renquensis TaxID=2763661 RepID=A0A926I1E8_9FIRM|nr:phage/plasmid primase, P4 family [Bianquea renquensis]MBC8543215.1 hypothetical protein [Bianquea renquensis]